MGITKTVDIEVTVDRLEISFGNGMVTVAGTAKGTLLGKTYTVNLPPSKVLQDWVAKLQAETTELVDKTGALWRA